MDLPEDLLNNPDAVLLRQESYLQIHERLNPFTVPLTFLDDESERGRPIGNGSGVLVQFQGRRFLLTAGHVLEALTKAKSCALGIHRGPHRFAPQYLGRVQYRYESDSVDYGFIELPPPVWPIMEAAHKVFAGPNTLLVETAANLRATNDWFVITGFPEDVAVQTGQGTGYRLLHASTTLAGLGDAPPCETPLGRVEALDLWLAVEEKGYLVTGEMARNDVPPFSGASGGGTWKGGVRPISRKDEWSAQRLKLVGIYIGSTPSLDVNGVKTRFYRQVLLGHHLRLIAETISSIRDDLFRQWPILQDARWMP